LGLKEDILFLEMQTRMEKKIYFYIFGEQRSCDGQGGGAQRPVSGGYELKDGCAAKTH
jgi:hypothetical protein